MTDFLTRARALLGDAHVLTEGLDAWAADWRGKFIGAPLAVLRPADTGEVAALVRLCAAHRVSIVPQGGNTGMCGGATPDDSGRQVVLSLGRLNRIRHVDLLNNTMTADAGCILQTLQDVAAGHDRLFPLSLGAQGSCQIGGNIATNAGGVQVLRYGNTRDLVMGLEVVLPDGQVLDLLRGLRKDNTGYDLRQLFIGSEGTLGIITAAVLKLFPRPHANVVALAATTSPQHAIELLALMRSRLGDRFTAFELISDACVAMVRQYFPQTPSFLAGEHPWSVLMQASDGGEQQALEAAFQSALESALETGLIEDVAIATSENQAAGVWALRETIPEAQQHDGANIKHDIAVPVSGIPAFIDEVVPLLHAAYDGVRPVIFGHCGDGNLHFNVSRPPGWSTADWQEETDRINDIVLDAVARYQGSFSAEHGLGQLRRNAMLRYKAPLEREVMRKIKQALDPESLMNPGKVIYG
ncbi:FAD-binding oxidoreductase [Cupriavidus sp. BIC8F]|uniref:FAD-binding oxidoreductase n=1 Tax=Cupriavidus sp. BIC8F TaxID=3079014 RepID=UPI002915D0EC|nr:FAD-binding oxidoreductase [Cupriavidus sp. BIC8F]